LKGGRVPKGATYTLTHSLNHGRKRGRYTFPP
jgi:hypothetical protein